MFQNLMTSRTLLRSASFGFIFALLVTAASSHADGAVKHLDLPDITTFAEAKRVFKETTNQLKEKTKLDSAELQEVHIITYSLEKAVAYFSKNLSADSKSQAEKMVEIVELIHIGSENDRAIETGANLEQYFMLADAFSKRL